MAPTRCVFCGKRATTVEHVFGQWLDNALEAVPPYSAERITMDVAAGDTARIEWAVNSPAAFTVRGLCKGCNSGWMSGLEGAASVILGPMFAATRPVMLGAAEQATLAAWAYKTALVLDLLRPTRAVTADVFHAFYNSRVPPRFARVLIGRAINAPKIFYACHTLVRIEPGEKPVAVNVAARTVLVVGPVAFFVLVPLVNDPRLTLVGAQVGPALLPLYPAPLYPATDESTWPPRDSLSAEGLRDTLLIR